MSVNWDGWIFRERGAEEARMSVVSPSFASPDFGVVAEIAVRPSEGAQIYGRMMDLEQPRQVLISTADFTARYDQWVRCRLPEDVTAGSAAPSGDAVEWADTVQARVAEVWAGGTRGRRARRGEQLLRRRRGLVARRDARVPARPGVRGGDVGHHDV